MAVWDRVLVVDLAVLGRLVGLDNLTELFQPKQFYDLVFHCATFSVPQPPKDALFISFPPYKFFVCTVAAFVLFPPPPFAWSYWQS